MADARWDVIIVGLGLAGTTLAWHLREAGQRVLVIDGDEPVTSSKIAAGLITPITGQRLVRSWRYDEFLLAAREFYTSIQKRTEQTFFHDRIALRLFRSETEQQNWADRRSKAEYQSHLTVPQPVPLLDPSLADASGGGFAMQAAQLDVAAYLEASRSALEWKPIFLDWHRDVSFKAEEVLICGHRARRVISCEGYAATRNPYFSWVPFVAAKGDILTVRFHDRVPPQCLHRGIWIAPTSDLDVFRVGSNYDWENLNQEPSASARMEIESKLEEFFHVPYTVLDHHAAVRPIITESTALIGFHPEHERLGFFNGLGSKGALRAPWYAQRFTDFLVHQTRLPDDLDLRKQIVSNDACH
jgi:glycine oxidase